MARKRNNTDLRTFDELIVPTLMALKELGGSGTIEEINENVYKIASIVPETLQIPHDENGLQSEVDYRLAWSRTYLKKYGLIENSSRGVWALTNSDIDFHKIDSDEIVKKVRDQHRATSPKGKEKSETINIEIPESTEDTIHWKQTLLNRIFNISPSAFERLAQRLLRESGFVQVEVTGLLDIARVNAREKLSKSEKNYQTCFCLVPSIIYQHTPSIDHVVDLPEQEHLRLVSLHQQHPRWIDHLN